MSNLILFVLLAAGIASIGTSYARSTQRPNYRPVRGAHLPPLVVATVAFLAALLYDIGRMASGRPQLADMIGGALAVLCGVATIILLRFDPMAHFRGRQ